MSRLKRRGDLQIEEDRAFERASWTVQHYAWVFMLALIIAGALGYAGSGPFSHVDAADPTGLFSIGYDRSLRRLAPSSIDVTVRDRREDGSLILWMDEEYAKQISVESMLPRPQAEASGSGMIFFAFPPGPVLGSFSLQMEYRPTALGWIAGKIGVVEGPTAEFSQFVYP
jgi:hypothetical protein